MCDRDENQCQGCDDVDFLVKLFNNEERWLPAKAHGSDACYDLRIRELCDTDGKSIPTFTDPGDGNIPPRWRLRAGGRYLAKTGVWLQLQHGWEGQVRARSGMAFKHGLMMVNGVGTIDAHYRGEIGAIIYASSKPDVDILYGERIAQLAFRRVPRVFLTNISDPQWNHEMEKEKASHDFCARGEGGYGSSGRV